MSLLFFLHIPKCAGMSLMEALIARLPAGEVYQSTSLIKNFRENRPEFMHIANHKNLRAVVGHWIHEAMLPVLSKPIRFGCSLRHPVERIKSQYRFEIGIRGGKWPKPSVEQFLNQNRDVICNFVVRAFPTIASRYDDHAEACMAVLSGMDHLFDVEDADLRIAQLVNNVEKRDEPICRVNESGTIDAALPVSDDEIASYCQHDLKVYEWFSAARAAQPKARNPVFEKDVREELARLARRPFAPETLVTYLASKLAHEVYYGAEDVSAALSMIRSRTDFDLKAERAISALIQRG